jgi:TM2 domain-containing membrane protein YozV
MGGVEKNAFVAYFLWFVGGFGALGLHHFYLGDDRKAFLWASSFGGLGLGSVRDLFFIPRYCRAKVDDLERRKSFPLLAGTFALCYYFSRVAVLALCNRFLLDGSNPWIAVAIRAVVCGFVAHLCLSSGNRRSNTNVALIALVSAVMQSLVLLLPPMNEIRLATFIPGVQTVAAFSAAAFAYRFRSFQSFWNRSQSSVIMRVLRIVIGVVAVFCLLCMAVYFNARIAVTVQEGEDVKKSYIYLADVDWSNDLSVDQFLNYLVKFLQEFEEVRRFSEDYVDEAGAYAELGLKVAFFCQICVS